MLSLRRGYSRIPVELLDIIMDYTDKKTQGSCSLVCRSWSPIARSHRFRKVDIRPRYVYTATAKLLCEPASTVLPYIRELHLEEGLKLSVEEQARSDTNESAFLAHARPQERQPWLEAVLPKIRVDGLTALRSLRLKNLDWEQLSARSRSSLVNLCQRLDALELVSFGGTCVPYSTLAELLSTATSLKCFSLSYPRNPPGAETASLDRPTSPDVQRATVRTIELSLISRVHLYLPILVAAFSVSQLRQLSLGIIKSEDVTPVISLLRSCAGTLEHLSLRFYNVFWVWSRLRNPPPRPEVPFCTEHAFSGMTSLRSLHLEMYDLRYIPAILRQLESRELVDVTVRATVQASDKGTLEALARCLSTGPLASARPRVSFICAAERNTRFSAPIMEGMRDALLTHLTDLRKEGRLRILRPTLDPMTRKEIGEEEF